MEIEISPHAEEQIRFRKLSRDRVVQVTTAPEEIISAKGERYFAQSRFREKGKEYLLRVLVEKTKDKLIVVTVYPTSKVRKYWRGGPK